jgi:hypothetical protein
MAISYDSAADRIEMSLPTAAESAGRRLEARYPNLVTVTYDDGMGRA